MLLSEWIGDERRWRALMLCCVVACAVDDCIGFRCRYAMLFADAAATIFTICHATGCRHTLMLTLHVAFRYATLAVAAMPERYAAFSR